MGRRKRSENVDALIDKKELQQRLLIAQESTPKIILMGKIIRSCHNEIAAAYERGVHVKQIYDALMASSKIGVTYQHFAALFRKYREHHGIICTPISRKIQPKDTEVPRPAVQIPLPQKQPVKTRKNAGLPDFSRLGDNSITTQLKNTVSQPLPKT